MDLSFHLNQFLFSLLIFLSSLAVLNFFVFKPTLEILREREKRLSGMTKEAKIFEAKTHQKFEAYNKLMDEARLVARRAREDILRTAETQQKEVINQARSVSEGVISSAKQSMTAQTNEARFKLRQTAQELAKNMVDRILKRKAA